MKQHIKDFIEGFIIGGTVMTPPSILYIFYGLDISLLSLLVMQTFILIRLYCKCRHDIFDESKKIDGKDPKAYYREEMNFHTIVATLSKIQEELKELKELQKR